LDRNIIVGLVLLLIFDVVCITGKLSVNHFF
jgi:hypothetical protein